MASRAAGQIDALRTVLADWNTFYDGYDPMFSWWVREPYGRLDKALVAYADALRQHLVGVRPGERRPSSAIRSWPKVCAPISRTK